MTTKFERQYFEKGDWPLSEKAIFSTYFWARRYYANLLSRYLLSGKVLEIGCGYGDFLSNLEDKYQTVGVEISKFASQVAKTRTKKTRIVNDDAYHFLSSEKNSTYDAVIQICVLPHMKNPARVVGCISKVLRPGGIFLSVVPNPNYPLISLRADNSSAFRDKTHINLYSVQRWTSLFKRNRFEILRMGSTGFWDVPYLPIIPKQVQLMFFGIPSVVQILSGRLILPWQMGVDLITVARKV